MSTEPRPLSVEFELTEEHLIQQPTAVYVIPKSAFGRPPEGDAFRAAARGWHASA
jgi:hypothetical protein